MQTVFEQIPDLFIEAHDAQFQRWAKNFPKIGGRCAIMFHRPLPPLVVKMDSEPAAIGVYLMAQIDRTGPEPVMVVKPTNAEAADLVAREVFALARVRLH
jgi:hypothetical protein